MINKQKQIEELYTSICNDWTEEEHYSKCFSAWEKIKSFISEEPTPYYCGNCSTFWTKVKYVNDYYNICPNCDTYWEPFLCNPINYQNVLKYINPVYHKYLLPSDLLYCKRCYTTDMPSENNCQYCLYCKYINSM